MSETVTPMSDSGTPMPRYRCNKEVWALKIKEIEYQPFSARLIFEGGGFIEVDHEYVAKRGPERGGYFVVYDDGYKSFSPAKAFEDGYTRIST